MMTFFHLSGLLPALYVIWRLALPLPVGKLVKTLLAAAVLLIGLKHAVILKFFGSLAAPDLPAYVLIVYGWLYGALVLLFGLLLLKDIISLLLWLAGKIGGRPIRLPHVKIALGLAALALLIAAYGTWQAVKIPEIRTTEISIANLPPELNGLSIMQVSDLHVSNMLSRARVEAVVAGINASAPDLIVFTGDMIDGQADARAFDVAPLAGLKARYGIYGCVGNHEYYSGYHAWLKAFAGLNIRMLLNQHTTLNINGQPLTLAGVSDPVATNFDLPEPDPRAALAGAPPGAFSIMLAHQPRLANQCTGANLILSGHTHGGQVAGMGAISARFNGSYVLGQYNLPGGAVLWVSPGAGLWNGMPLRLGVPAEISRIVLKSAS